MAKRADLFLHPESSTDIIWLSAVTKYMIDQGWEDKEFLNSRVNNVEKYIESLSKFTLAYAEEKTGLTQAEMIQVAEMIHDAKSVCILWAMGITQHMGATDSSTAIANLLLVTGNFGTPGNRSIPIKRSQQCSRCVRFWNNA